MHPTTTSGFSKNIDHTLNFNLEYDAKFTANSLYRLVDPCVVQLIGARRSDLSLERRTGRQTHTLALTHAASTIHTTPVSAARERRKQTRAHAGANVTMPVVLPCPTHRTAKREATHTLTEKGAPVRHEAGLRGHPPRQKRCHSHGRI